MIREMCRWLAIRLMMRSMGRQPDFTHGTGSVEGSLPYYREWRLLRCLGVSLSLVHLASTSYKPMTGAKFVLLGWYRAYICEEPRRIVLRDVAGFSFKPERVELPPGGNCWVLRLARS